MWSKGSVTDLLNFIGVQKIGQWKGDKINFCCPIHQEKNPSCGINVAFTPDGSNETIAVFHCFSCGAKGTLDWFLFKSMPDRFRSLQEAAQFIKKEYGILSFHVYDKDERRFRVKRYEDFIDTMSDTRVVLSSSMLSAYRCGKETFQYFFDRGFDRQDIKFYSIGRDFINNTVVIPVLYSDGLLAGFIGRYVHKVPYNKRFLVYQFQRSDLVYLADRVRPQEELIVVESCFDAMMMHKWGFTNTVAIMGNSISKKQAEIISRWCRRILLLFDHDDAGRRGIEQARKILWRRVDVIVPGEYPDSGSDPLEWGEKNTRDIIVSTQKRRLANRL